MGQTGPVGPAAVAAVPSRRECASPDIYKPLFNTIGSIHTYRMLGSVEQTYSILAGVMGISVGTPQVEGALLPLRRTLGTMHADWDGPSLPTLGGSVRSARGGTAA
jgi:hypothetical protein